MLSKAIDKRFRPRWLKKQQSSSTTGTAEPPVSTSNRNSNIDMTPETPSTLNVLGTSAPTPASSATRKLRLNNPFTFLLRSSKSSAAPPAAPKPEKMVKTSNSAIDEELKTAGIPTTASSAGVVASSADSSGAGQTDNNMMRSGSKSELSVMTTQRIMEDVKAKLMFPPLQEETSMSQKSVAKKLTSLRFDAANLYNSSESMRRLEDGGEFVGSRRTALHSAVELDSSLDVVQKLLKHNKDIDLFAVNEDGDTALHMAARNRNADLCIFFIEQGLDPNMPNLAQKTAIHLAGQELGYTMMFAYYSMLKTHVENDDYATLAIQAARSGSHQMLAELTDLGAELKDVEDEHGRSLAEICRANGFRELALALESNKDLNRVSRSNNDMVGNVSFSTTGSNPNLAQLAMNGKYRNAATSGHVRETSSSLMDLNSAEVKALMNEDTGTDVMNSPIEISSGGYQGVSSNAVGAAVVSHARQLSQANDESQVSPSVEYDDKEEDLAFESRPKDEQPTVALRVSRFSIRDLP